LEVPFADATDRSRMPLTYPMPRSAAVVFVGHDASAMVYHLRSVSDCPVVDSEPDHRFMTWAEPPVESA
jgi:hypothetical protein